MTDKPLGRVIDIDAYFESLQQPQPQTSDEAIVSMSTTNMPQPEAAQTPHPESMPPVPYTDGQPPHVWPREGGLSIEEMLSFEPETIILLNHIDGRVLNQGIEYFFDRYEKHINFHGFWPGVEAIPHVDVERGKYQQVAERFLREGYLCSPSGYQHLDGYTVKEIQAFLRGQKLKVSGKRDELIARLKERFSAAEIEQAFPARWLILTSKGEELMEYHRHLIFFWKKYKYPYDIAEIHKPRISYPHISSKEVTFKALQELMDKELSERSFDRDYVYRTTFLRAAECHEFFGTPRDAAIYYALICYLDINEPILRGYNSDEFLAMWGGEKEYPSADRLLYSIVISLENALDDRSLDVIKEEFLAGAQKLKDACSPDFLSPETAWDMIIERPLASEGA